MLDAPATSGGHAYDDLLANADPDQLHFPEDDEDATTVIMFTSGTTSVPKGAQLTHDSFATFLLTNVEPADPDVEETNLLTVPMYHVAGPPGGAGGGFRRPDAAGDAAIRRRRLDDVWWQSIGQIARCWCPTMLKMVMDHPNFDRFTTFRPLSVITYGAAPMPLPVIRQAIDKFPGARFINAFGQTETASTITMLPPGDHDLTGTEDEVETKLRPGSRLLASPWTTWR